MQPICGHSCFVLKVEQYVVVSADTGFVAAARGFFLAGDGGIGIVRVGAQVFVRDELFQFAVFDFQAGGLGLVVQVGEVEGQRGFRTARPGLFGLGLDLSFGLAFGLGRRNRWFLLVVGYFVGLAGWFAEQAAGPMCFVIVVVATGAE